MKHKGSTMEYAEDRTNDLMRAYDEYIASCDHIRMPDVYNKIVNMPSRRFWVSDIRAALVVSAIIRGDAKLDSMWPMKREMYLEIHRRVMELGKVHTDKSVSELCSMVVAQPAPKFYLAAGSAKVIVCKARKRWRKEKLRRLRLL